MKRATGLVVILLVAAIAAAQETSPVMPSPAPPSPVTLGDVLVFEYPGVVWTLEEPAIGDPEITMWNDARPKPLIAALEALRDTPSAALLEAVRTGVFPDPPAPPG